MTISETLKPRPSTCASFICIRSDYEDVLVWVEDRDHGLVGIQIIQEPSHPEDAGKPTLSAAMLLDATGVSRLIEALTSRVAELSPKFPESAPDLIPH